MEHFNTCFKVTSAVAVSLIFLRFKAQSGTVTDVDRHIAYHVTSPGIIKKSFIKCVAFWKRKRQYGLSFLSKFMSSLTSYQAHRGQHWPITQSVSLSAAKCYCVTPRFHRATLSAHYTTLYFLNSFLLRKKKIQISVTTIGVTYRIGPLNRYTFLVYVMLSVDINDVSLVI